MLKRYLLTLSTMLALLAVHAGYTRLSQALLIQHRQTQQVATRPVTSDISVKPVPHGSDEGEKYLADAPWVKDARVKVRGEGLQIYYNQRIESEDKTEIRVQPVALVWSDPEKAHTDQANPVVILAKSASFSFLKSIELSEIRTDLLNEIQLLGTVLIRDQEGMEVKGTTFVFSRANQNLRSDNAVEFRLKDHFGSANAVQLNLKMLDGPKYNNQPQVVGLTDLLLRNSFQFNLAPENQAPVLVTCEGQFQYRFAENLATMNDQVVIRQLDDQGFENQVTCDHLLMQFKNPAAPAQESFEFDTDFELQSLVADGNRTTGQKVVARFSQQQLQVAGERMSYDLIGRHIVMQDRRNVITDYQGTKLVTPQVDFLLDEENHPIQTRLAGPGTLIYQPSAPSDQEESMVVKWRKELSVVPDPEAGTNWNRLTLLGQVILTAPQHSAGIISQSLKVWFEEFQDPQLTPEAKKKSTNTSVRLHRALAEKEVAIASPYLEGEYETLEILFEENSAAHLAKLQLNKNESEPDVSPGTGSGSKVKLVSGHSSDKTRFPAQPIKIDARDLKLSLLHDPKFRQFHVAHVDTQGRVSAFGQVPGSDDTLEVHGQGVEIFNDGPTQQRFQLMGSADRYAWIQNNDLRIEGINLSVDRDKSLAEVLGEGTLQIPVTSDFEGMPLGTAKQMEVSWKEEMKFEGNTILFLGQVSAKLGESILKCEQLRITLDQRISLREKAPRQQPKLARIDCEDRVRFEMQHYENGKLMGVRYLNVWTFSLNQQTGEIFAQGPGTVEIWQIGDGKSAMRIPEATMTKGPGKKDASHKKGWDYTHLAFDGRVEGNMHKHLISLTQEVNLLHGPVERPLLSFGRDRRPADSVWIRCDQLDVYAPPKKVDEKTEYQFEVRARGNSQIEGDRFLARADLITYDHARLMFIMRAIENREVNFWHFRDANSPRSHQSAKRLSVSPNGNNLELGQATGGSVSQ